MARIPALGELGELLCSNVSLISGPFTVNKDVNHLCRTTTMIGCAADSDTSTEVIMTN